MTDPLTCPIEQLEGMILSMISKVRRVPGLKSSEVEGKTIAKLEQHAFYVNDRDVDRAISRLLFTDGTWMEFRVLESNGDMDITDVKAYLLEPEEPNK
jgi:hypothetical protein